MTWCALKLEDRFGISPPRVRRSRECDLCKRGLTPICRQQKMPGNDVHGGFASHIVVPGRGLCMVDPQRLAATGLTLQPQGGTGRKTRRGRPPRSRRRK